MSNEADYDMCITTDLTIEIDEPTTTIVESFEAISVGKTLPKIGPPKSRDEALALCKIGEDVVMDDLPKNMKEDLCSHLNLPSYGTSLRNWETVAAKLGGNLDFIMGLRALKDPTLELITRYRNFKVNVGAPTDSACSTMSFYPDSCVILVTHYEEKKTMERCPGTTRTDEQRIYQQRLKESTVSPFDHGGNGPQILADRLDNRYHPFPVGG
ncbi:unnamed protein product, partial [Mesorhabditis spiculigera]